MPWGCGLESRRMYWNVAKSSYTVSNQFANRSLHAHLRAALITGVPAPMPSIHSQFCVAPVTNVADLTTTERLLNLEA